MRGQEQSPVPPPLQSKVLTSPPTTGSEELHWSELGTGAGSSPPGT